MSLDHIKREMRRRREKARKQARMKKRAEMASGVATSLLCAVTGSSPCVVTGSCPCAATGSSPCAATSFFLPCAATGSSPCAAIGSSPCGGESDDAWVLELAAMIETSLGAGDSPVAGPSEPAEAAAEAPAANEARRALDNMRKLWRAMRRSLPQLPVVNGKEMRKQELADSILSALGVGWAPLPEWGCPEGIDAYMARLMVFAGCLADFRGCAARDLPIPLSTGSWEETLIFEKNSL